MMSFDTIVVPWLKKPFSNSPPIPSYRAFAPSVLAIRETVPKIDSYAMLPVRLMGDFSSPFGFGDFAET